MREQSIQSDINRTLTGKGFFINVLGMVLAIILSQIQSLVTAARGARLPLNGYHAQFIMEVLASDWVALVISIFPLTTSY